MSKELFRVTLGKEEPKFCRSCGAVYVAGKENDPAYHWFTCRLVKGTRNGS